MHSRRVTFHQVLGQGRPGDAFMEHQTVEPNSACARKRVDTRRAPGFTLVELLVVISIIVLLISILLPSLTRARAQAKSLKCLANSRGLGQAALSFSNDNKGRFQLAAMEEAIQEADPGKNLYWYDGPGEILAWPVALAKAGGYSQYKHNYDWGVRADDWAQAKGREDWMDDSFELALCPADPVQISTPYYPKTDSLKDLPTHDPPLPDGDQYWGYLSYGINEDIVGADDASSGYDYPNCWRNGFRGQLEKDAGERLRGNFDRIYNPSTCLLLVDSGPETEVAAQSEPDNFANLIISAQCNGPLLKDFQQKWEKRMPRKRHPDGRLNVLFADYHAEAVKPVQFFETEVMKNIPKDYDIEVRVSPYPPWNRRQ